MANLPETNESLLVRIRDPLDAAAWERFVALYRPAVYRLARRSGLQDADAEDLAQQVLANVARAIGNWRKDAERRNFRSWLMKIARNAILNELNRGRRDAARGGTSVLERLHSCQADHGELEKLVEDEHRRMIFRWVAAEVEPEFKPDTWLAFWMTAINGLPVERAAEELGKSPGAVYAGRSRIVRRLREVVREFEED